jgi:GxxExxY protein
MSIEKLTETVIGCGIIVHRKFGPGLLESVYDECMVIELVANDLIVEVEKRVPLIYRDQHLRNDLKLDLCVEGRLIVEIKAVERLHPVHEAQLITYLKLTGCPAGLLMNFNATSLRQGLRRLDHLDIYAEKKKVRLAEAEEQRRLARSRFSKERV